MHSSRCRREFGSAAGSSKYIIPVLLPTEFDVDGDELVTIDGSTGWYAIAKPRALARYHILDVRCPHPAFSIMIRKRHDNLDAEHWAVEILF
jgi:hypothetical protein